MEFDLQTILNFILGAVALFASVFAGKLKLKLSQVITLGKEFVEFSDKLQGAIADDKVTQPELVGLKKEWADVKNQFGVVVGKKQAN